MLPEEQSRRRHVELDRDREAREKEAQLRESAGRRDAAAPAPDPSFIHRSGPDLFADLLADYDRSLNGGVDWNGDTYRSLLDAILDVAHLAAGELDGHQARVDNEYRRAAAPLASLTPAPTGVTPHGVEEVAAAVVRQLQAAGLGSPSQPDALRDHANALPAPDPVPADARREGEKNSPPSPHKAVETSPAKPRQ